MIEFLFEDRCTSCGQCVTICPQNVFEFEGAIPVIARQEDCHTCTACELLCPADALYVSPLAYPEPGLTRESVIERGLLGSYARTMNWHDGVPPQGIGDNYALQLRETRGERAPDPSDRIRQQLFAVRDRNYI